MTKVEQFKMHILALIDDRYCDVTGRDPEAICNQLIQAAQDEVWDIVDKVLKNPEVYQIWYSDMQNKIMVESHDADVPDAFGDDAKEAFLIMIKNMEKNND